MKPQRRALPHSRNLPGTRKRLPESAQEAYVHLTTHEYNTDTLAKVMDISRSTAFRLIRDLRGSGYVIRKSKRGNRWHYEVIEDLEKMWRDDPVLKLVGFINTDPLLKPGETIDDVIYGQNR